ncbi:hypothetical protein NLG97_g4862 [Lecanicillium saksenae]|uniref:Uncharacterized protein n=1 Tax=Lecanicillium saksenae TaxID=468837 RepID=A0ACC1QUM5_9HYPO|nr:hypothetical protein NLG97_g4862 [Lecanicillium saksenae]
MSSQKPSLDLKIEVVSTAEQVKEAFGPLCEAFGVQTQDAIFIGLNPGWDTPDGRQKGEERFIERFTSRTFNHDEKPNTIFLNATVVDPATNQRVVAGVAVWEQASTVVGYGDLPPEDEGADMGIEAIYPNDLVQQKLWTDVMTDLHASRWQAVRDNATSSPPAIMVLDICAVDPRFQGHGIGRKLVEWGLEEAKLRGDLELVTEASVMGRRVYQKLGFEQEGPETVYNVDASLSKYPLPSNVFLRTRKR